jgi:RimJ/RimL family protein N-acetyltransferase
MISGRNALGFIEDSLHNERSSIDTAERRINEVSRQLLELQGTRIADYRELARLRVDMMAKGNMITSIDVVSRQVAAALEARKTVEAALDARIGALQDERAALEVERENQRQALEKAAEALDVAEAATQARLDADPDYLSREERVREAERIAMHAEDKARHSEQEKDEKGQSYTDDALFMYLWGRHYGTPQYRAWPVTRWLDTRVAHLIGFADARANFARLQEIPVRLREHADQKKRTAEAAFEMLRELDEQARREDGIVDLETARDKEQASLEAIDSRIEEAAGRYEQLLKRKEDFAAGEDEDYRKAVDYVTAELQRDDMQELRRDAMATPFPDDDLIVNRLFEAERQVQQLESSLKELNNALHQQHKKLQELESLRTDFRHRRYDQAGYSFSDGALIAAMLSNFINGRLDLDSLWRVLEQQQRYRPQRTDPTFGSGGFGRGTVWGGRRGGIGGGLSRGGFGRGSIPRSRRGGLGGSGGFRTGGGF